MSGGLFAAAIVAAMVVVALGLQVTARHVQRFPVDSSRPGGLLDTSRRATMVERPVEVERLRAVVAESLASPGVSRARLDPILAALADAAPHPVDNGGESAQRSSAVDRLPGSRPRARQLERRLEALEAAWGLGVSTDWVGAEPTSYGEDP